MKLNNTSLKLKLKLKKKSENVQYRSQLSQYLANSREIQVSWQFLFAMLNAIRQLMLNHQWRNSNSQAIIDNGYVYVCILYVYFSQTNNELFVSIKLWPSFHLYILTIYRYCINSKPPNSYKYVFTNTNYKHQFDAYITCTYLR